MSDDFENINLLHVDDESDILDLTSAFINRQEERISVISLRNAEEGLQIFRNDEIDCIVSDYDMPGTNGLEFLKLVREDHPDVPFILFTGKGSEEIASRAIEAGVTEYLQKGGPEVYNVLVNRISNSVEQYRTRYELERFEKAVEYAGHAIYMTNAEGKITYVNPVFEEVTGFSEKEAVGESPTILNSGEHGDEYFQRLWKTISNGEVWYEEVVNRRSDGDRYRALQTIAPIQQPTNGIDGYVAIQQDISDF